MESCISRWWIISAVSSQWSQQLSPSSALILSAQVGRGLDSLVTPPVQVSSPSTSAWLILLLSSTSTYQRCRSTARTSTSAPGSTRSVSSYTIDTISTRRDIISFPNKRLHIRPANTVMTGLLGETIMNSCKANHLLLVKKYFWDFSR